PLGPLRHRRPPHGLRPRHAGRDPGLRAPPARGMGRSARRRLLPRRLPARRHLRDRGRTVRRTRLRSGPDLGGHHPQRGARLPLPLRVLPRDDRAARDRGPLLRRPGPAPPLRPLDGLDQAPRRCHHAGHGRVLLLANGDGAAMTGNATATTFRGFRATSHGTPPVLRYALGLVLALIVFAAAPAMLAAQDGIGLPVGERPPAVEIEDLDGAPVDLGQYIGKKPVLIQFWATWCPLCEELKPQLDAARARFGD